tara:strand:- start:41000 stop:41593 length:594 start_codon:yes stop_codon:yes gene_type:complete
MPKKDADNQKPDSSIDHRIQKKFLDDRKVFLWGEINSDSARVVTDKLLFLEWDKPGDDITFYINTPGGSVTDGLVIYNTMKMISSPVTVVVTGLAASMGSILLSAPQKGRRLLYPHARVLIHQPLIAGQFQAVAVDINIQATEMEKTREEMNTILAEASGQSMDQIREDTDRDFYLSAEEAIKYGKHGLADKIIDKL